MPAFHSAPLAWDQVTTDQGGGALTGLAGYRIYGGTNPASLSLLVDVGLTNTPSAPAYTIQTLSSYGVWYFNTTAYDPTGNESARSNMITKQIIDDGPGGGFF